ncbi:MAG: SUMF1/EgtB/PvdO family nonheme iron enzyme [Gemmatimonadaceae bacterium]
MRDDRWTHRVALPEIRRLAEANRFDSAFMLATRAEKILGNDSTLESLWERVSGKVSFTSVPAGASVFRSAYHDSVGWTEVSVTPADSIRLPLGVSRYRFELAGHHPVHVAGGPGRLENAQVVLQRLDSSDGRMVHVNGGRTELSMPGLSRVPAVVLPAFHIDRHEVTNGEYGRFVRAGGYTDASFWEIPIIQGGRTLSFAEAQRILVDRTGRAGPAGWEGGDFPTGQDQIPVGGVSWYEAAAYAKFTGKSLPSMYHWNRAATRAMGALIIPGSNYGGRGPTRILKRTPSRARNLFARPWRGLTDILVQCGGSQPMVTPRRSLEWTLVASATIDTATGGHR